MTPQEQYRAAFCVHAPKQAVQAALSAPQRGPGPRRPLRLALALAAAAALLITSVSAEIGSGAVSNLLAPAFGSTRTELLEGFGRPVGASASAGGYTLTAEAILGDRHSVVVAYTITREDGQPMPELCFFDSVENNFQGTGGGTYWPADDDPTDNRIQYYQQYSATGLGVPRILKLSFSDLTQVTQTGEEEYEYAPLAQGPWKLSFACRYPDSSRKIKAEGLVFCDESGHSYTVDSLSLSCLGLYLTGTTRQIQDPGPGPSHLFVSLADGTQIHLGNQTLALHGSGGEACFEWQEFFMDENATQRLISPDDVVSVTLGGVTVPV